MQKLTQCILIGLSATSITLSGMNENDQLKKQELCPDYTFTIEPQYGYIDITQDNRPFYKNLFKKYGIKLDNTVEKLIPFKAIMSFDELMLDGPTDFPLFVPLNMFTQGAKNTLIFTHKNPKVEQKPLFIQLVSNTTQEESSFKSHEQVKQEHFQNKQQQSPNNIGSILQKASTNGERPFISNIHLAITEFAHFIANNADALEKEDI
jgi:hypothetical protein